MDKQELRERVWRGMEEAGAAAFPFPPQGRIPNFTGAAQCARFLSTLPEWRAARRIKCNPDAPQRAVRRLALEQGKEVVMAVPRLTDEACFFRLDPKRLAGRAAAASTIKGAAEHGVQVTPEEVGRVDLIVAGSVAVDRWGGRVGKGGGYSDLEFALARELDLVNDTTLVLTTVHPLQVIEDQRVPMTTHDVPLDLFVTPEGVTRVHPQHMKPPGILWDELSDEQLEAMPPLRRMRERQE